jgi:hypothetical protein
MNKSCCFVVQYNTEALVLVLQYYFGNEQYSSNTRQIRLIKVRALLM